MYKMCKRSVTHLCVRCALRSAAAVSYFHGCTPQVIHLPRSDDCLLFLPPAGQFLTTQQTCVSKCPGGSFAARLSGVCEACPRGCSQCVDAQHCTRCQSTRKAQLFLQDGQCVQQCVRSAVTPIAFCFLGWLYSCAFTDQMSEMRPLNGLN